MGLLFTQAGMVLIAALIMIAIVGVCLRYPVAADLLEIFFLFFFGFGGLVFSVIAAFALSSPLPFLFALLWTIPALMLWPTLRSKCAEVWRRA